MYIYSMYTYLDPYLYIHWVPQLDKTPKDQISGVLSGQIHTCQMESFHPISPASTPISPASLQQLIWEETTSVVYVQQVWPSQVGAAQEYWVESWWGAESTKEASVVPVGGRSIETTTTTTKLSPAVPNKSGRIWPGKLLTACSGKSALPLSQHWRIWSANLSNSAKNLALVFSDQPLWIKMGSEKEVFAKWESAPVPQSQLRDRTSSCTSSRVWNMVNDYWRSLFCLWKILLRRSSLVVCRFQAFMVVQEFLPAVCTRNSDQIDCKEVKCWRSKVNIFRLYKVGPYSYKWSYNPYK